MIIKMKMSTKGPDNYLTSHSYSFEVRADVQKHPDWIQQVSDSRLPICKASTLLLIPQGSIHQTHAAAAAVDSTDSHC